MKTFFYFAALLCSALPARAQMTVSLAASEPSPQPLGTPVTWTASVSGAAAGTLWYRFRTRESEAEPHRDPSALCFHTIVDYGPSSTFTWSTIAHEGVYEIEVSVRNIATGETVSAVSPYGLTPLALSAPAVTPTTHPLVFIYSAPPCAGRMRVRFTSPDGDVQSTPFQNCTGRWTMNFYVAGMRANATYLVQHELIDGASDIMGPRLSLATGSIAIQPPRVTVMKGAPSPTPPLLVHAILNTNAIATDLNGNIVWYVPFFLTLLTRAAPGGAFLGIVEDGTKDPSQQIFRKFDLTGATLAETNAARVSGQLAARGMHPINSFHHEAIQLPNGRYLVMAGSERILADVQGPGPVDVLGDTILVLDPDLQLLWAWDAFDYLDPHRQATLGETCTYPASVACSNFYEASTANDWVHSNALQLTPDGNILYSIRHQDWAAKIDYRDGAGTGAILWKMGVGGDFQIASSDPYPWFSHQHDPNFLADNQTLLVFDNGNTRIADSSGGSSRAQVYHVDEANRTVTPIINTDLGVNSSALGTVQLLTNGHYHVDAGFFPNPDAPTSRITQLYELDETGAIVWTLRIYAQEYRNFRMLDLYTPPVEWVP